MTAATRIETELAQYVDRLVDAIGAVAPLEAVDLLGSASLGADEPGRSDADVVAVTTGTLGRREVEGRR